MNFTPGDRNETVAVKNQGSLEMTVGINVTIIVMGITINYINAMMIHTFNVHHIFRLNPRFILFIHLVLNDMIQLTVSISLFIFVSAFRTIYVYLCFFFIIPAVLTSHNTPLNLAFMAIECYIAVCFPLRHSNICTVKRTYVVIGVIWTMSLLSILPDVFIFLATESLEFMNSKISCKRDSLFKSIYSLNKRDASHIFFLIVVWFTLFYIYSRILFVAKAAETQTKKARNTILLHGFQLLLIMLTYVNPMLFQAIAKSFPGRVRFINTGLFVTNHILPRFLSPFVYGFRDKTFWKYLKNYLCALNSNPSTKLKELS